MRHRGDRGFTLVEILIAIVLVGILTAVVVVGVGSLTSKGSTAACQTSLDAARVASTAHTVSTGAAPTSFTDMVTSGALSLPSGVTADPGGRRLVGSGWQLLLQSANPWRSTCLTGSLAVPADLTTTPLDRAYSLRKVVASYAGPLVRVRRSSDNTTADIGFTVAGDLDVAALMTFVGNGGSGFVTTWYDQSGNGRNATQTTTANQPQIVTNGSYRSGLDFVTLSQVLVLSGMSSTWFAVATGAPQASANTWASLLATGSSQHSLVLANATGAMGSYSSGSFFQSGLTWSPGEVAVVDVNALQANVAIGKNGGALTPTGSNTNNAATALGNHALFGQPFGLVSEVIIFSAALSSADRLAVDRNAGTYYGVTVA